MNNGPFDVGRDGGLNPPHKASVVNPIAPAESPGSSGRSDGARAAESTIAVGVRCAIRLGLMLIAIGGGMAIASTPAMAKSSCGGVAPPLNGRGEEDNFANVTVSFASCHTGRRVALDWLDAGSRYHQLRVDGWFCRGFPAMGFSAAHMRCTRGNAVILGFNDGD
jgi:hypothetical protein